MTTTSRAVCLNRISMDKTNNKRDRSPQAEERRKSHQTIDFTGWFGLMRSLVSHKVNTVFLKKPTRKWAAARRAAPFVDYLPPDKMEIARRRHKWRQKELKALNG